MRSINQLTHLENYHRPTPDRSMNAIM